MLITWSPTCKYGKAGSGCRSPAPLDYQGMLAFVLHGVTWCCVGARLRLTLYSSCWAGTQVRVWHASGRLEGLLGYKKMGSRTKHTMPAQAYSVATTGSLGADAHTVCSCSDASMREPDAPICMAPYSMSKDTDTLPQLRWAAIRQAASSGPDPKPNACWTLSPLTLNHLSLDSLMQDTKFPAAKLNPFPPALTQQTDQS